MINNDETSLKNQINKGSPNQLPSYLQTLHFGDMIRQQMPVGLMGAVAVPDGGSLGTLDTIVLPDSAKALSIFRAYARTTGAAGTLGELAAQAFGATPADAQIAVSPNGNIVVLAASDYTLIDLVYMPMQYDLVEVELPAVTGVVTLPSIVTTPGVVALLEAVALTGTVTGNKVILVAGAAAPATLQARLNLAKTTVTFNVATDAVLTARLKLAVGRSVRQSALLEATAPY